MKNLLKVAAFSLLTIAFFAGFANFGIPKIEPAPPPKEEKLDLGTMTMDKFIALGDKIYNGKGTCTLCHNAVGGRAPLLDKVMTASAERLSDSRYQGKATDVESYLYESMMDPSAYVVAGFGKAGTNDTESPMPDVSSGSIGLSEVETEAVIAYLQDLGGAEVTVEIPTDAAEATTETEEQTEQSKEIVQASLNTPEDIITKLACGACHNVAGQVGVLGPDLTQIGSIRDKEYLRRAILDPNADIAEGFVANMMPATYGDQLSAKELELLVVYLAELK